MKHERILLPHCAMDVYLPDAAVPEAAPRPSVVICPGGGYQHLSPREAEPVALAFAAKGFHACVVWYRLAPHRHPAALHDVAAAVAWVRAHAQEHHADPDAIAVLGFSAGGHAAGSLGVRWQDAALMAQAGLTSEEVRPNAMVLCYPVVTGGAFAHRGSFVNLTGVQDRAVHEQYSLDTLVTGDAPPTFLWHTFEDGAVPVENTLLMASALRRSGVLTELHIFPHGGHGLALANPLTSTSPAQNIPECAAWVDLAARFLRDVLTRRG